MADMLGMEWHQLFSFSKQLGLALAGAACLWGFFFLHAARKRNASEEKKKALEWASRRLLLLFSFGFILAAISWSVLWNSWPVLAHEGINLYPGDHEYRRAFLLTLPVYVAWIFLTAAALILWRKRRDTFEKYMLHFYGAQFLVIAFLISLYAWTGDFLSKEQFFFYFHGFHSIFTLGTVLTLDFLFLSSRFSLSLQKHIFPFFPAISKIIFVGLGLDFLSVYLVFGDALRLSARFFAAQTIVGILIINGAILAGPMTRRILTGLQEDKILSGSWKAAAGVCGPISIVSWTTITLIDFFPGMTLSYAQIMAAYVLAIFFGVATKLALDKLDEKAAPAPGAA